MKTVPLLALVGAAFATAGLCCAGTHVGIGFSIGVPPPVIVHRAPPPRVVEQVVVTPGPGYVWVPGHYTYSGGQWVWLSGAWMQPPRPDARWADGSWNPQTQQWVDAHWEIPAPATVVTTPPPPPVVITSPAPVVAQTPQVVVAEPPPPPVQEVLVASPGPGYIWVAGYWGWENGRRQWFRGHWELPPRGYHAWIAPRWEHRRHGYVYIRGYWR